jgi:hypothetical protein
MPATDRDDEPSTPDGDADSTAGADTDTGARATSSEDTDASVDADASADTETSAASDNWWQRRYRLGDTLLRASSLLFAVGLGILFANGPLLDVEFSEGVIQAGEYLFIVAIGTVVFAVVVMLASLLGNLAARRGLLPAELSVPRPW